MNYSLRDFTKIKDCRVIKLCKHGPDISLLLTKLVFEKNCFSGTKTAAHRHAMLTKSIMPI